MSFLSSVSLSVCPSSIGRCTLYIDVSIILSSCSIRLTGLSVYLSIHLFASIKPVDFLSASSFSSFLLFCFHMYFSSILCFSFCEQPGGSVSESASSVSLPTISTPLQSPVLSSSRDDQQEESESVRLVCPHCFKVLQSPIQFYEHLKKRAKQQDGHET